MHKSFSIFITGATGFIGRAMLPRLLADFAFVRAAVRSGVSLSCESFRVGSIDGRTCWAEGLRGIDAVVHLAGFAHINRPTKSDLDLMRRTNVDGTASLAQQAAQAGVRHFVFVSSIGAVCEQAEQIIGPGTQCNPSTAYGKSKLEAEKLLIEAAAASGMEWTIIRPPLVYGPGNPGNMERLLKLIRLGIPLPLASVRNRRSFIYVGNLVDLVLKCLGNPKAFGKIFLPADGENVSTPELIRKIEKAETGTVGQAGDRPKANLSRRQAHAKLECIGDGCTAPRGARLFPFPESLLKAAGRLPGLGALRKLTSSLYVDSEPIRRDLSWTPPFTMEEGLRRTLEKRL
jgi:nucleoside-diphosphate-sugar epimerase